MKKVLAMLLVLSMVFAMVACGGDGNSTATPTPSAEGTDEGNSGTDTDDTNNNGEAPRVINIGTWYEGYYTSAHHDINDNPNVTDVEIAQMQLDNMRAVEKRYNIELYYKNLTWNGVIESINTSIMAGAPNCDIYMVDLQFGVPAVLAGYAASLEDMGVTKINDDVMTGFKFTPDDKTYLFGPSCLQLDGYPLGYNKDMLDAAGLTDPYELYEKGEWTWDVWMDYMKKLTDVSKGVYGYRGAWTNLLDNLLMSNDAAIAGIVPDENGNIVERLSSKETTEVLNFMKKMYVDEGVTFWNDDCNTDWNSSVYAFGEGKAAFFNAAAWILNEADKDQQINLGVVPWPLGPSVTSYDDVAQIKKGGTMYMIPTGLKDPKLVYDVMYDHSNWYDGDLELRDDTEWFEQWMAGRENNTRNFEVLKGMGDEAKDITVDLWGGIAMSDEYNICGMIMGNCEVSQVIETNKNIVQDYLDAYFAK